MRVSIITFPALPAVAVIVTVMLFALGNILVAIATLLSLPERNIVRWGQSTFESQNVNQALLRSKTCNRCFSISLSPIFRGHSVVPNIRF
jgi:hypothetical protein